MTSKAKVFGSYCFARNCSSICVISYSPMFVVLSSIPGLRSGWNIIRSGLGIPIACASLRPEMLLFICYGQLYVYCMTAWCVPVPDWKQIEPFPRLLTYRILSRTVHFLERAIKLRKESKSGLWGYFGHHPNLFLH